MCSGCLCRRPATRRQHLTARAGAAGHGPLSGRIEFRRYFANALAATGQHQLADRNWAEIIRRDPLKAAWWQTRAASQNDDPRAQRQQLAVAHALKPNDHTIQRDYLISLIGAEQHRAALSLAKKVMNSEAAQNKELIFLAVRAAYDNADYDLGKAWLSGIAEIERQGDWQRWALYLASASDDHAAALAAIKALMAAGDSTPRLRLHAAQLAEALEDDIEAESQLRGSASYGRSHASRPFAACPTARKNGRLDEADGYLQQILRENPRDEVAKALMRALDYQREQTQTAQP